MCFFSLSLNSLIYDDILLTDDPDRHHVIAMKILKKELTKNVYSK